MYIFSCFIELSCWYGSTHNVFIIVHDSKINCTSYCKFNVRYSSFLHSDLCVQNPHRKTSSTFPFCPPLIAKRATVLKCLNHILLIAMKMCSNRKWEGSSNFGVKTHLTQIPVEDAISGLGN